MFNSPDDTKGFIVQGKTYTQGFVYFDPAKPAQVEFSTSRGGKLTTYTTDDVSEFAYDESRRKYLAKTVTHNGQQRKVFVEIIREESLYYMHNEKLFLHDDNGLQTLTKESLLPYLKSVTEPSASWNKELNLIKLRRNSLNYFARNQAEGKSPTVMFTHFGLFLSNNTSVLQPSSGAASKTTHRFKQTSSQNVGAGLYADLPAWPLNNLSLYTQLGFGKMRFNETINSQSTRYDTKINMDFIRFAIQPKYTLSFSKLRLFAQAGPTANYNVKRESQGLERTVSGDRVYYSRAASLPIKEWILGLEAGAGVSYFFVPNHYVALQVSQAKNFSSHFNISNQAITVSVSL
ncbi:outer membrane beta-barrel protein [Pontibacter sp. 13R65]|uniref:outer membrane beta-barrel protein n=1 Tax=Pontibacter sp. 13R65 TaxID=3127458 RepID=UPI00301D0FFC